MDDLATITTLFDGYRVFYEQTSDPDGARAFMQERLEQKDSVVFMAESESGEGAGFTQLYPLFSSVRMRRIWLLNDLYVAPEFRRQGVGHALMVRAQEFAAESGAAGLELATAIDNAPAKSVYHDLGWTLDTEFHHYSFRI